MGKKECIVNMLWFIIFTVYPLIQNYENESKTSIFKWVGYMDDYVTKEWNAREYMKCFQYIL